MWAYGSMWPSGEGVGLKIRRSGIRFPVLAMCRNVGQTSYSTHLWSTQPQWVLGSIVAGCIGAHLARGKVKSIEHPLSWSLDCKQLPLPLPVLQNLFIEDLSCSTVSVSKMLRLFKMYLFIFVTEKVMQDLF